MSFTKASVASLIKKLKDGTAPDWADGAKVKHGTVYIGERQVVPAENVDAFLRDRVYDKNKDPIVMSRDAGWTDFLEHETYGISRRAWHSWLQKQDTYQRSLARPKPDKNPGQKVYRKGQVIQIDLVEVKADDLPGSRSTDTYFFTAIDLLSGYLVTRQVRTKEVDPRINKRRGRGTLVVLTEILDEMKRVLGRPVETIQSDAGAEFLGAITKTLLPSRNVKKRIVPLGATIENANGRLQRAFFSLVRQKRGGTVDKLLAEATAMVNNTTSRITKFRASEAVTQPDRVLAERYNSKRQAPMAVSHAPL